jgi:hypothetical protein
MAEPEPDAPRTGPWSTEDHLAFDLAFALPRTMVRGIRRAFTEDERSMIAKGMVEHLRVWQEMIASEIHGSQVALHGVINSIAP